MFDLFDQFDGYTNEEVHQAIILNYDGKIYDDIRVKYEHALSHFSGDKESRRYLASSLFEPAPDPDRLIASYLIYDLWEQFFEGHMIKGIIIARKVGEEDRLVRSGLERIINDKL